jgi:hypothetical protein
MTVLFIVIPLKVISFLLAKFEGSVLPDKVGHFLDFEYRFGCSFSNPTGEL